MTRRSCCNISQGHWWNVSYDHLDSSFYFHLMQTHSQLLSIILYFLSSTIDFKHLQWNSAVTLIKMYNSREPFLFLCEPINRGRFRAHGRIVHHLCHSKIRQGKNGRPPEQMIPRGPVLHLWGERCLKNLCLFSWILDCCLSENPFLWPLNADCCDRSCTNKTSQVAAGMLIT